MICRYVFEISLEVCGVMCIVRVQYMSGKKGSRIGLDWIWLMSVFGRCRHT